MLYGNVKLKEPEIAGKPLESTWLQRKIGISKRECIKQCRIRQSAAKPNTGERSTTSPKGRSLGMYNGTMN